MLSCTVSLPYFSPSWPYSSRVLPLSEPWPYACGTLETYSGHVGDGTPTFSVLTLYLTRALAWWIETTGSKFTAEDMTPSPTCLVQARTRVARLQLGFTAKLKSNYGQIRPNHFPTGPSCTIFSVQISWLYRMRKYNKIVVCLLKRYDVLL